jgi:ABC-type nitrate/sulfonate/bicarbonate transport system ATPase subunit/ABC-type nitrate/sulfonate/bicarbonate transport system permease component
MKLPFKIDKQKLIPTLVALIFLSIAWQITAKIIGFPEIFPSFSKLVVQVFLLLCSKNFLVTVMSTILRGFLGFFIAFVLAFLVAVISNFHLFWRHFFHPILVITRSVPVISFVLIAIFWFSPSQLPVFIALLTMFPILTQSILTGLEQTDIRWIEMAKITGKSPIKRLISIYLLASKKSILDGMNTALGFGWRAIIIGEVLAQPLHGIGSAMKQAQSFMNTSELMAWTVIAILISYLFDGLIKLIRSIRCNKNFRFQSPLDLKMNEIQIADLKEIDINELYKGFNDKPILEKFSFHLNSKEIYILKAPSGRGKTTLLRLISGVEKADNGMIKSHHINSMSYVFQDLRLLPWLTVAENIQYGMSKEMALKNPNILSYLIDKMELTGQANQFPDQLSGGQQQRVNIARALAANSDLLLLDEPFSGLDMELKNRILLFLIQWIKMHKPLVIWATHEAVEMHDLQVMEINL